MCFRSHNEPPAPLTENQKTPIAYMTKHENNVLWRLHADMESDAGFHRGADISMLSQYESESEGALAACLSHLRKPWLSHVQRTPGAVRHTPTIALAPTLIPALTLTLIKRCCSSHLTAARLAVWPRSRLPTVHDARSDHGDDR